MKYLVTGSEGPGYATPEQAIEVSEKGILPTFDALMNLEADKKFSPTPRRSRISRKLAERVGQSEVL